MKIRKMVSWELYYFMLSRDFYYFNFSGSNQQAKSNTLQKVTLEVFKNSECNKIYAVLDKVKTVDEETKLCVGSSQKGKDT